MDIPQQQIVEQSGWLSDALWKIIVPIAVLVGASVLTFLIRKRLRKRPKGD